MLTKATLLKYRQLIIGVLLAAGIMLPMTSCSPVEKIVTPEIIENIVAGAARPVVKAYLDDHRDELENIKDLLNDLHDEIHTLNMALDQVS